MQWLCRAQDCSTSADGGVARHYSLLDGWSSSYPETTGYIAQTFLAYHELMPDSDYRERADRMLKWLASIQSADGGFQGGMITERPVVPVTFNTGQILLGFAAGAHHFSHALDPLRRGADWLVRTQDGDGCWRRHPSPFVAAGEKVYDTHVAWGLLEADRVDPGRGYAEAAVANVRWAMSAQAANGWLDRCCLDDPQAPLTHTLGYGLRGILETYRFTTQTLYLEAAARTADGLLTAFRSDGFLPGRLNADWSAAVNWVCLTGTAQIGHCLLMLFEFTGDTRYRRAGLQANAFVRRTVHVGGAPEVRGAVKGSLPMGSPYGRFQYLNWAAKFLADSLMLELRLTGRSIDVESPQQATRDQQWANDFARPISSSGGGRI